LCPSVVTRSWKLGIHRRRHVQAEVHAQQDRAPHLPTALSDLQIPQPALAGAMSGDAGFPPARKSRTAAMCAWLARTFAFANPAGRETPLEIAGRILIQDASQLHQHKELGDDFDLVFLRHQNFWHGQETWKKSSIRARATQQTAFSSSPATSTSEHKLALAALRRWHGSRRVEAQQGIARAEKMHPKSVGPLGSRTAAKEIERSECFPYAASLSN